MIMKITEYRINDSEMLNSNWFKSIWSLIDSEFYMNL